MKKLKKAYKEYRFADVTSMLTTLMTNEFSSYYLDYTKDILYIEKKDDVKRRQVQTVLISCFKCTCPFMGSNSCSHL